jgi:hypothetical protein
MNLADVFAVGICLTFLGTVAVALLAAAHLLLGSVGAG